MMNRAQIKARLSDWQFIHNDQYDGVHVSHPDVGMSIVHNLDDDGQGVEAQLLRKLVEELEACGLIEVHKRR